MKVYMIWARDGAEEPHTVYWLDSAWDSDSISENSRDWEEAKKKAYNSYGGDNVRILTVDVDMDAVIDAFAPVDATVKDRK